MWKKVLKNCLLAIIIIILLLFLAFQYFLWSMKPKIYKNPKDYQVVKEKIVAQDKIKHFPKEIPANATEILMYGYQNTDFYGEVFLLSFKTDREFIEKELKKYDFWNKNDKIGTKQKIYHMYKITDDFNPEDYTYFLIKDLNSERYYKKYFPLLNGIGVDGKHNKILYYHIIPED